MKPHIYTKENAYIGCHRCTGIELCRGTNAWYSCSTWRNRVREVHKKRKCHPDIMLQPYADQVPELFIRERNDY